MCATPLGASAESAPRKPVVISGSATNMAGLLVASPAGAIVELPSRTHLRMAPNAQMRIFPLPQLLALNPGPRTWTWSFALQSGRVDVELPKTGRNAVLVNMGKLSSVVTSGYAAYRVDGGEATAANIDGELRTLLNDHWQTVPPGSLATLSKEDPNATVKPNLPSPRLTSTQRMWFAPHDAVPMHGFKWSAVPGASRYDLRVRHLPDGKIIDQRSTAKSEWAEALTPVEPGRYSVALRSVDARGLEGSWGAESEVRVIGVVLPPGGYATEQAIYIGEGQQVQFTNTDGLEMTYVGAGRYFPAAQGAALYRNQKTVIGFRIPGSYDSAVAVLEPRGIYADIKIGPRKALWPRDPISIDIQLKSKTGGEIPSFVQVVPTVTLGTEPVDVSFEQNGNILHAVVPPSDKPGPWVVRVDVADQYGVDLGHEFLEVSGHPRKPAAAPGAPTKRPAAEPPVARSN